MITVLTGLPRAGKSYFAVSDIMLPALKSGRKVITNIEGIKVYKISSYLDKDVSDLIELVEFDNQSLIKYLTEPDYAGYLFIVDEAHRYYSSSEKLSGESIHSIAVHGHNTQNSDGTTGETDLVLITQTPSSLNAEVLNRSAQNIKAVNLRQAGMSKKFKVSYYSDPKLYEKSKYDSLIKTYDNSIHQLYSSSTGRTESKKVKSIFTSFRILMMIPALIAIIVTVTISYKKLQNLTDFREQNEKIVIQSPLDEFTGSNSSNKKTFNIEENENETINEKGEKPVVKNKSTEYEVIHSGLCTRRFRGHCISSFGK